MTTITLDHVTKVYHPLSEDGPTTVSIDDLSLRIHPGEVVALMGPSGCGKTTLLKMIAGLIKPDSGEVLYDNVPLPDLDRANRRIGMVFQDNALMPHWDSRQNIGFYLQLRHREDELEARLERISAITGFSLALLLDRKPGQLSGGEKQRVAVARALARDLNVLLCDEPFSNLDAPLRSSARVELKRLLNEFPVTTVYATHDQVEAMSLATRIVLMRQGHIEQVGTYQHLYRTPRTLFVATFIGMPGINLFEGTVRDGRWWGENFGGLPIRSDLPNDSPITLGIRPENLRLVAYDAPGDARLRSPAVVEHITPLFAERSQLIDLHLAGERWSLLTDIDDPVEVGSTIHCDLDAEASLFFDSESGLRIG
jgi:ABC-type sugar transport system ATPase subunit